MLNVQKSPMRAMCSMLRPLVPEGWERDPGFDGKRA
jgi:hypothetical protein